MMKRFVQITVSFLAAVSMSATGFPAVAFASENATQSEIEQNNEAIQEAIDGLGGLEAGKDYDDGAVILTYAGDDEPQLVELDDAQTVEGALEDALHDDSVVAAQPNYRYSLMDEGSSSEAGGKLKDALGESTATNGAEGDAGAALTADSSELSINDPLAARQYYLNAWDSSFASTSMGSGLKAAWGSVTTDRSVSVAVLDTGVQATHEDLKGNIDTAHMATIKDETKVSVGSISDKVGHGTHVAGIIAASANNGKGIAGVSYNARLIPINVFKKASAAQGGDYYSSTASCITAIKYLDGLIESGQVNNLHVLNLSLGAYSPEKEDEALRAQIAHMRNEHNVLTVCAGGNGDSAGRARTERIYPGDFDECLSVTALNRNGTNATWSDYNEYKDLSAPGVKILSTFTDAYAAANGNDCVQKKKNASYGYMDGTSMAAPIVSGCAALLWSMCVDLDVESVVMCLQGTANTVNPAKNDHSAPAISFSPGSWGMPVVGSAVATGSKGAVDAHAAVSLLNGVLDDLGYAPLKADDKIVVTKPKKPTVKSAIAKTKGFKVKWKSVVGASGYQIRYRVGSGSWKCATVADAMSTGTKVSKLKAKKKYTVQVRAYRLKTSGSKLYGTWSATKTVKTK